MDTGNGAAASRESPQAGRQVRLADKVVPLSAVRGGPARFTQLFARAKAEHGHAECLCATPPLKLVIRVREGRYHLARWPGEGDRHTIGCGFHKVDPGLSGRGHYTDRAILETEDGTAIRLGTPLETQLALRASEEVKSARNGQVSGAASRRAVGLLGLLHWLWEEAQLTMWDPSERRSWRTCHDRLVQHSTDCTVNGRDLSTALYMVPPYRPQDAVRNAEGFAMFCAQVGRSRSIGRRGLIVGEIKDIYETPYGKRLALRHLRSPLFASAALIERVQSSYRIVFSAAVGDQVRRVALFLVERTSKDNLIVVDMAAMLTNQDCVPADSSYEVHMADQLAAAGRSFVKPLRYEGDEVFPDFVITDVTPHVYVEVYGVRGRRSYDERKRVKQDHYRKAAIPVIEWDVTQPLPELSR
ncbi:DUF1173 family protein [Streptosporangium canum]|uniref:DUF1173 family protein n=1 Tax=Streptosporangium canum TaxID=324952 RepID=UPI0036921ACD